MFRCCRKAPSPKYTILIIGIDNAGKTTLTYTLKNDLEANPVPTVGYGGATRKKVNGADLTFYDLGGGSRIRAVWTNYFSDVHGAIYVVDSADPARLEESKEELKKAVDHPMVVGKPLLILANKQDLPAAMSEVDVSVGMGLDKLTMSRHRVIPCVAKPANFGGRVDDRITDGINWLCKAIASDYENLGQRVEREMEEFKASDALRREANKRKLAESARVTPATGGGGDSEVPMCTSCKTAPATRRCAASNWEAACEECIKRLEEAKTPKCSVCKTNPATKRSAKTGWEPVCDGCAEGPRGAPAPAPAAAAAPESEPVGAPTSSSATASAASASASDSASASKPASASATESSGTATVVPESGPDPASEPSTADVPAAQVPGTQA